MASSRRILGAVALAAALAAAAVGGAPLRAEELRDPTAPPSSASAVVAPAEPNEPAAKDGPLVLTSIVIAPGRRIATIGGRTVRVGDTIGDVRIASITAEAVVIETPEGRRSLRLAPASVRKAGAQEHK